MTNPERRSGRTSSHDRILDAAAALVAEHGMAHVTLEAAAAAAAVTKAGLIYHFKTRDDLLLALVERMVRELDIHNRPPVTSKEMPSQRAQLGELVKLTLGMSADHKRLLSNMLVAASAHPPLLPPVRALYERNYDALAGGPKAGLALLLSVALDGILFLELLQLHQFNPSQHAAMRKALLALVRELP